MFRSTQVFYNSLEEYNYEKIYKQMKNAKYNMIKKNLLKLIVNRGGLEKELYLYVIILMNILNTFSAVRIIISWLAGTNVINL